MFLKITQNSLENTCTGVSFLSAACSFINEETQAVFSKVVGYFRKKLRHRCWLGYKYTSVLPPDLKPSYKNFPLYKSVIKIATVLYYHHIFVMQRDKIEQQSNTS